MFTRFLRSDFFLVSVVAYVMTIICAQIAWYFAIGAAIAQNGDTAIDIDLSPIVASIVGGIGLLITALVGWACAWLRTKWGIEVDKGHREALQAALNSGVNLIVGKVVPEGKTIKIEVGNSTIADAVEYAIHSAPDAMKHFGLSKDDIIKMLEPKILAMLNADPDAKNVSVEKAVEVEKAPVAAKK